MKIAVITHNWHGELGGIEKYNRTLYENFKSSVFTEFPLFYKKEAKSKYKNVEISNLLNNEERRKTIWLRAYSKKNMLKIFNQFDLVVFSTNAPARKWIKKDNAILVQHMDKHWYFLKQKTLPDKFAKLFSWMFGIDTFSNTLKRAKNVFYYSKETAFVVSNQNAFFAPLTSNVNISTTERKGAISIGRIDKKHKNIPELVKIANQIDDFEVFGDGPDKHFLQTRLENKTKYKFAIASSSVDAKLQKKRVFVMTSNYEGFSYAIVEALSNGCAVCMYDTFDACNFFRNCKSVFLFNKNDTESITKKIHQIISLSELEFSMISKQSVDFSKRELSISKFTQEWKKVIK